MHSSLDIDDIRRGCEACEITNACESRVSTYINVISNLNSMTQIDSVLDNLLISIILGHIRTDFHWASTFELDSELDSVQNRETAS